MDNIAARTIRKGYKQTEVGVIPEDWDVKEVGEITTSVVSGRSNTTSDLGSFPIYGSTGIIGYKKVCDYQGDKILVARVGANAGFVNKVSGRYCVSDNTLMISYKENIDIDFSYYQLTNYNLNKLVFGSGQPLITGGQLKKIRLPLPLLRKEQSAIASILLDLDLLIRKTEKLISKKRLIKKGAMQELLTGKRRLLGFTKRWDKLNLTEITLIGSDSIKIGPFGSQLKKEFLVKNGYKVYGQENVYENDVDLGNRFLDKNRFLELKSCELLPGDFIISMMGTIGKCMIMPLKMSPGIMDSHLIRLRLDSKKIDKKLLLQLFSSSIVTSQIKQLTVGGIMEGLSSKIIKQLNFNLPSIEEQIAISSILSDIEEEIGSLESKLLKYRQIKQGMMDVLLTGKIRLI